MISSDSYLRPQDSEHRRRSTLDQLLHPVRAVSLHKHRSKEKNVSFHDGIRTNSLTECHVVPTVEPNQTSASYEPMARSSQTFVLMVIIDSCIVFSCIDNLFGESIGSGPNMAVLAAALLTAANFGCPPTSSPRNVSIRRASSRVHLYAHLRTPKSAGLWNESMSVTELAQRGE